MDTNIKKLMSTTIDAALVATDKTWQEHVAIGAVKVWAEVRQNEPYAISDSDAALLAFNAQRKDSLARNKRLKVQIAIPAAIGYTHAEFKSFDNNVARLKLTIMNAPHLPKALKIVDKLILDGVIGQKNLVLHKAMEAVGAGTGETWNSDKRKTVADATTAREKRDADKLLPDGFTKRLKDLMANASDAGVVLGEDGKTFAAKEVIEPMKQANAMPDEPNAAVLDADTLAEMMGGVAYQDAGQSDKVIMMAAFMSLKK